MPESRKRGRPKIEPQYDIWVGVQDARERKKIQDRLAQRARRKRAGLGPRNPPEALSEAGNSHQPEQLETKDNSPPDPPTDTAGTGNGQLVLVGSPCPSFNTPSSRNTSPRSNAAFTTGIDHHFFYWPARSIYAALGAHGLMQGTSCPEAGQDARCPVEYLTLPEGLRPTPLQLAIPHRRWIDRFPFPRFRDNMILLTGLIDLDNFVEDLFGSASFTLRQNCVTWEPGSWVIGTEFSSKWGYLFC